MLDGWLISENASDLYFVWMESRFLHITRKFIAPKSLDIWSYSPRLERWPVPTSSVSSRTCLRTPLFLTTRLATRTCLAVHVTSTLTRELCRIRKWAIVSTVLNFHYRFRNLFSMQRMGWLWGWTHGLVCSMGGVWHLEGWLVFDISTHLWMQKETKYTTAWLLVFMSVVALGPVTVHSWYPTLCIWYAVDVSFS